MWPKSPPEVLEVVTVEDSDLLTTPEPYIMKEQGGLVTMEFLLSEAS